MDQFHIKVLTHRTTGLLMAMTDDLPGFIVHADTPEELYGKLAPALVSFLKAAGREVTDFTIEEDCPVPDFVPIAYIARAQARAA